MRDPRPLIPATSALFWADRLVSKGRTIVVQLFGFSHHAVIAATHEGAVAVGYVPAGRVQHLPVWEFVEGPRGLSEADAVHWARWWVREQARYTFAPN